MAIAIPRYRRWVAAARWLCDVEEASADEHTLDLVRTCREYFEAFPWNAPTSNPNPAIQLTTTHLSALLGHAWCNGEQMNAGADWIMRHGNVSRGHRMRIANSHLLDALQVARSRSPTYIFRSRSTLDCALRRDAVDILEVIVNSREATHWAAISLDLRDGTYTYRDGKYLNGTASAEHVDLLLWYPRGLNARFMDMTLRPAQSRSFHPASLTTTRAASIYFRHSSSITARITFTPGLKKRMRPHVWSGSCVWGTTSWYDKAVP